MTKAQHLGLVRVIAATYLLKCRQLHHAKHQQHGWGEPCPAEKQLKEEQENAYKILKELSNKPKRKKNE